MKRNYKIILPLFLILSFIGYKSLAQDVVKDKILMDLVNGALKELHYSPAQLDNDFSVAVHDNFIKALDPTKRFFLKEDIKNFSKCKNKIDDEIRSNNIDFYHRVITIYKQRIKETEAFYGSLLETPFDFELEDTYNMDYENIDYPKNKKARLKVWEKQLKFNTLNRLYNKVTVENDIKKDSAFYVVKSFEALEIESREKVLTTMKEGYYARMNDLNDDDWFSIYLNIITAVFDPHTTYYSPQSKKKFDIDMSGQLEGIGARLQKKGDYIKIVSLISGGPAWRAGELEVGDLILKVAQKDEEAIDVVGMRMNDAIDLIKGKKGSEVKLTLKKISGSIEVISIIRDIVELEETFAKSSTVQFENKTYGLINLPSFYYDFTKKNGRSSSIDMAKEIESLKKENIEGLVIDLRNNGGGSLKTAIEIAGLFIKDGPVVQVKHKRKKTRIDKDTDKRIQWNGALVILVNEISASASEIFAAAMQDYNRAIIIGSNQTFGKGTVQSIYNLDNFYRYKTSLGAIKLTVQKFYRINGGSTQLKGVASDVAVPDRYTYLEIGERDEDNPLVWDKIEPANYQKLNFYSNYTSVINDATLRVNNNPQFQLINENAKWIKTNRDDKEVFLSFAAYKKDLDNYQTEGKRFDKLNKYTNNLTFKSPAYEISLMAKDSILAKKREIWHTNLSKDIYVEEALRVLSELKLNNNVIAIKG